MKNESAGGRKPSPVSVAELQKMRMPTRRAGEGLPGAESDTGDIAEGKLDSGKYRPHHFRVI